MLNWFNNKIRSARGQIAGQGHMTFGQSSIGRSMTRTRLLLKKQLWIWPIVAVVLLAFIGWLLNRSIEQTMVANLRAQLQTLVNVERSMLEKWFAVQESSALTMANDPRVRQTIADLLAVSAETASTDAAGRPLAAELNARLAKELDPGMSSHDFVGYIVADRQQRIIAAKTTELNGKTVPQYETFLSRAADGHSTVSPPFPSVAALRNARGELRTGTPTMFVCVPVRDDNFQVIAVLALRIQPEREFTNILQLGRFGDSGETYAVNKAGVMVSNSRFDESLVLLGLLPDRDDAASIVNLQVRDPGGNMLTGFRPGVRRRELPLTESVASVTSGATDVNLSGYRDYKGSPTVGAWSWLPGYQLGIITEVAHSEAYRPLTILRRTFFSLFALLAVSAAAIFVFTLIVARLRREAQKAEIEAKQLGQYRLQERIGAGAMGVVYKGQHAMLRRPTAIKMLDVDKVNEASIGRFEREVQITCKLNNPHTVAIYDYGRTPEGVFYYAMEFLDGLDLQTLVAEYGPQPEGRVVSILQQICASLYEAHSLGLVHRDVKPANVMLNRRGGEPDVVKVLDFGLVKAQDEGKEHSKGALSGTPLYMSPEAIESPETVDARSDLYAVGAVGYFLLTGKPVFDAQSLSSLCEQHLTAVPSSPSETLGRNVSEALEHAILACLEKSRAKRPQTARDLSAMLGRVEHPWSLDDAETWWSRRERGIQTSVVASSANLAGPQPARSRTVSAANDSAANMPATGTIAGDLDRTMHFDSDGNRP